MFCIRTLLRIIPILSIMTILTACADNILDSGVLLAASKVADVIKPIAEDSKIITPTQKNTIMNPNQVKQMIQSLRSEAASSKQLAK